MSTAVKVLRGSVPDRSNLPSLVVLLTAVGACSEAIVWARGRAISQESLSACPHSEWRGWLAETLGVSRLASWETWLDAVERRLLSGYGYGYGYGSGDGYGDGSGYGYGDGYGEDIVVEAVA